MSNPRDPEYFLGLYAEECNADFSVRLKSESRSLKSVHVPVAARLCSSPSRAMQVRNEVFQICIERCNAFRFRALREQLLFEIKIERQRRRKIERELRRVGTGKILSRVRQSKQFGVQLNRPVGLFLRWRSRFIVDEQNLSLQKRSILIYAKNLEPPASFRNQVEPAVGVFFYYADDFGGASHLRNALLNRAYNAKSAMLGHAFANHLLVTRLEDMQRQGSAGEQYDIERK